MRIQAQTTAHNTLRQQSLRELKAESKSKTEQRLRLRKESSSPETVDDTMDKTPSQKDVLMQMRQAAEVEAKRSAKAALLEQRKLEAKQRTSSRVALRKRMSSSQETESDSDSSSDQ